MQLQRTLKKPVHAVGIGVHNGKKVTMTLRPAPVGTGIHFVRTDLDQPVSIACLADQVADTMLCTTIASADVRVSTVEHLMSAFWGLGIDNALVELDGEEVPILDGSSAPFIYLIKSAGIEEQSEPKAFIRIKKKVEVRQGDAIARLSPYRGFKAAYTFVAEHPVYNQYPKSAEIDFGKTSYEEEVSRARSFGLVKELEQAQALDKCLGSGLDNAVGIGDEGVLNPDGLRYHDEFVKHKILDAIGDLYLLGRPIIGAFYGYKSGHGLNNQLARAVLAEQGSWELVSASKDPLAARPRSRPILQPLGVQTA
jgi:UDP-3-O-[3-hydroxymyristoyl] N-acetylglucosamine deacetylase